MITFHAKRGPETVKGTSRTKHIPVNGFDLHYLDAGRGDALVFVHGSLSDFRTWSAQKKFFSKRCHAVAYSRRYHYPNASPDDSSPYSADLHAEDLAGFINALGFRAVHLIGSSYGAYTSLITAVKRPELVRTLVLGEPPILSLLRDDPEGGPLLSAFLTATWTPSRKAFESNDRALGVKLFYDGVTLPGSFQKLPRSVRIRLLQNGDAMQSEMLRSGDLPSLDADVIRRINAPCLLLTGEYSPTLFVRINQLLEKLLPNAERAVISAASHSMHSDNARAYNERVMQFLSAHAQLAPQA